MVGGRPSVTAATESRGPVSPSEIKSPGRSTAGPVTRRPFRKVPLRLARSARRHPPPPCRDRKSTRLNSSHGYISYAVFCLKKKKHDPELRHDSSSPH